ncbi:MAG TPA: hypothetical protein PK746_03465 [Spirochaetales bacterium]|nr:hypothetical protein [Spirochaetales bacterium]
MIKTCSGLERDFILDTLIKNKVLLKNNDGSCILEIVSKAINHIQTIMHSNERTAPESGMYIAELDRFRTVSLALTYKKHENTFFVFMLPETIAINEKPLEKHRTSPIELICTLGHEQLGISTSKQVQNHVHTCVIFSELRTPEQSMYVYNAIPAMHAGTFSLWQEGQASLPALARIAQETNKLLLFDYMHGIPETACCIGNRLITRDDFEIIVKQSSKQTHDEIKQELTELASQKINLCIYPLRYLHESFSDCAMWKYQNLIEGSVLATIHALDAVVLGSLCIENYVSPMVVGLFVHGILIMNGSALTNTTGTCMIVIEKRRIHGTITFFLLSKHQSGYLYYGQFSAFEPEDFRYLAEYILQTPLTEQDFDSEEFQFICSL